MVIEKNTRKPRLKKIMLITASVLAVIVLLAAGAGIWISHRIRQAIEKEVAVQTDSICRIRIDRIGFNPVSRSLRLEGIAITTDSVRLAQRYPALRNAALTIGRLSLSGFRMPKQAPDAGPAGHPALRIGRISLESPHLRIVRAMTDTTQRQRPQTAGEPQKRDSRNITIGLFQVTDGDIEYCEIRDGQQQCHTLRGLSVQTKNFRMDANNPQDGGWLDNGIRTSVQSVSYQLNGGAVVLQADTITVDTRAGEFSVRGIRLLPQYPKSEFASLVAGHPDWTQVVAGRIACTGVNYAGIVRDKKLAIDSMRIEDVQIGSFKNRQVPQKPRIKPLFYQSLHKLRLGIDIRRVSFDRIRAEYEELSATGIRPGAVTFDSLSGDCFGLTNVASPERPDFTLTARAKLMKQGDLEATFRLPADSADDRFRVDGTLGTMSLKAMNPAIEPLASARINAGRVNSMEFHIAGNARQSQVDLLLLYDDLNVSLMKRDKGEMKARRLLSAIVDELVIRTSNPDDGVTRTGTGVTERDPYRSQFNYLWKSLLPGIKQTVIGNGKAVRERRRDRDRR